MEAALAEVNENNYNNYSYMGKNQPDKEIKMRLEFLRQLIPKKTAAFELYKEAKLVSVLGFGTIFSVMATATFGALDKWAGAISAGIISIAVAYYIKKAVEKMKYLESAYGIDPKAK